MTQKKIVAVLGMHRSGTSVITRGLQVLGVELGDCLLPPQEGVNDKGFWEDCEVTEFNNEVLAALGREWDSLQPIQLDELHQPHIEAFQLRAVQLLRKKTANVTCFGLKDPRMPRLMPFWQEAFAHVGLSAKYVIACRNPMSVAHSLAKRNSFPLEKGYLLWLEHMLSCLKQTHGQPRVFVDYDEMLRDPSRQLARISTALDLPFVQENPALAEYRQEFLENNLRHNDFELADLPLDSAVPTNVLALSQLLHELSRDRCRDDSDLVEQVDALFFDLNRQQALYRLAQYFDQSNARVIGILSEREEYICAQNRKLMEAEQALVDRSGQLESSEAVLALQIKQNEFLQNSLTERSGQLECNEAELALKVKQIEFLNDAIAECTGKIESLRSAFDLRNEQFQCLEYELQRRESFRYLLRRGVLRGLSKAGIDRLRRSYLRNRLIKSGLFETEFYLSTYPDVLAAGIDPISHYLDYGWREGRNPSSLFSTNAYLENYSDVLHSGVSPLIHYLRHGRRERRLIQTTSGERVQLAVELSAFRKLRSLIRQVVQQPNLFLKFIYTSRRQGLGRAINAAFAKVNVVQPSVLPCSDREALSDNFSKEDMLYNVFRVVPYYLNPYLEQPPAVLSRRIAVHLHFFYEDLASECIYYLNNIPVEFDLFVSIPEGRDTVAAQCLFRDGIPLLRQLTVESVPNRGRDIAPFIIQFGQRLSQYDVIGHFHTKKSPHPRNLSEWFGNLMDVLCGSRSGVAQIFQLLADDGKVVYPAGNQLSNEHSGWSDNLEVTRDLLQRFGQFDVEDFPYAEFPQGAMFWARADCLQQYLQLDLSFSDFPTEPIKEDGTLADALERSILIYSTPFPGRNYRLESPALSLEPQEYYEEQYDYSGEILHNTIKVLAYYLPQFHPTPENDEWHGEGFTEWYKVQAANPLFQGHFQQHVPHEDTGYYHLDAPEQLQRQADQMRLAGVHGMIFYHYWFSGKLILEKPAQILLANPDIDMPYSFCWANENWTRRWDGNEQEILLGQDYSKDDALEFIRYLIPFFKDERYIKVDGRPLLFVYRPSSMESCDDYMQIWREECGRNDLPPPYVVATMTRGAVEPQSYGMDAAVERVLQDWTGGAVPNIKDRLRPYWPVNGSVLDYNAVADHYMTKDLNNDYMLFRSLVPTWDNTARYGTEAYALHKFNTRKMQEWMEQLIRYSEDNLPADRRFVVVNAWNEWAEGAHLEPDTRFGYGYLNSIGRALCGYDFHDIASVRLKAVLRVAIELGDIASQRLQKEPVARRKFLCSLANSGLCDSYSLCTVDPILAAALQEAGIDCIEALPVDRIIDADYTLVFSDLCLFAEDAVESLLKMARRHPGFEISATLRNHPEYLHGADICNFEISSALRSIMELQGPQPSKGFKACPQANCYIIGRNAESEPLQPLDAVSTVIRFHNKGDRSLLTGAIFSLLAQRDCRVRIVLTLQDLDDDAVDCLQNELDRLPWDEGCQPILYRYRSTPERPDLRAIMLNDGLKQIGSGYAASLDYDDVLFPDAYCSLLKRLKMTEKNATFGRVFSAMVDLDTGLILRRDRVYISGFSYDEFVRCNHAPLHSFMFNLDRIELSDLVYFEDMKYMEDYYLTLQVFSRHDTDWLSLTTEMFIGDYVHRIGDSNHTLALADDDSRKKLIATEDYQRCQQRIDVLRDKLIS